MYERVGTLDGDRDELTARASSFEFYWAPQGYWAVDGRVAPLEEVLGPYVKGYVGPRWDFSMLVKLEQGNTIPPHTDKALATGLTRYHFVLSTDPYSWCMHDGVWQQLEAGGVYTMRPELIHAAINWGATPRLHLVVDV